MERSGRIIWLRFTQNNNDKMKKTFLLIVAVVAVFIAACSDTTHEDNIAAEASALANYVAKAKKAGLIPDSVKRQSSGLYYVVRTMGHGDTAVTNQYVRIRYTCYPLTDSTVSVSNLEDEIPATFQLLNTGSTNTFPQNMLGLHEAVSHLREGSKATVLVPSPLGTSTKGFTYKGVAFKGYTTLRFEIEVTDIQN